MDLYHPRNNTDPFRLALNEKHVVPRNLFGLWNVSNINHDESLKVSLFGCLLIRRKFLVDFDQTSLTPSFYHSCTLPWFTTFVGFSYILRWILGHLGSCWDIMTIQLAEATKIGLRSKMPCVNRNRNKLATQVSEPALSQLQLFAACTAWPSQLWQPYSKGKHWNKMAPQPVLLWPTHLTSQRGKNEQALDKPHLQYSTFKEIGASQLTQPLSLPRFSSHWFTGLPGMRLLGM